MLTLFTFGPFFGLLDASPFVTKAMLLLKMAGLAYREDRGGYGKAPKGKLPYIDDDGTKVADSTLIRRHIESKYGFDFDEGLGEPQKAVAWAVERMCEDHLYWAIVDARWLDDANFASGPLHFFDGVPALIRPFVRLMIRRKVARNLNSQGLGRHSRSQIEAFAGHDIDVLAELLGDKPFLMGDDPVGADATMFGFVDGILSPIFETPIRTAAENHPNLVAYRDRMKRRYFSEV